MSEGDLAKKGLPPSIQLQLEDHEKRLLNPTHKTMTAAPQANDVPEGGFVISTVGGVTNIYVKHLGVVKKVGVA